MREDTIITGGCLAGIVGLVVFIILVKLAILVAIAIILWKWIT